MKTKRILLFGLILFLLSFIKTPSSYSQVHQHGAPAGEAAQPQKQAESEEETPTVEIEQDKQKLIGVKTVEATGNAHAENNKDSGAY